MQNLLNPMCKYWELDKRRTPPYLWSCKASTKQRRPPNGYYHLIEDFLIGRCGANAVPNRLFETAKCSRHDPKPGKLFTRLWVYRRLSNALKLVFLTTLHQAIAATTPQRSLAFLHLKAKTHFQDNIAATIDLLTGVNDLCPSSPA